MLRQAAIAMRGGVGQQCYAEFNQRLYDVWREVVGINLRPSSGRRLSDNGGFLRVICSQYPADHARRVVHQVQPLVIPRLPEGLHSAHAAA